MSTAGDNVDEAVLVVRPQLNVSSTFSSAFPHLPFDTTVEFMDSVPIAECNGKGHHIHKTGKVVDKH
jgi:hypothetical protein